MFLGFTRARYRRIAQLAEEVDRVLHNADTLSIQDAEEGELSILHSELTKMTLRLREQNAALRREKRHLADALADIAHQLRTPLTAANLTLSLLKTTKEPQERRTLLRETQVLFRQIGLAAQYASQAVPAGRGHGGLSAGPRGRGRLGPRRPAPLPPLL